MLRFDFSTFGAMFSAKNSRVSYLSPMVIRAVKFPWKGYKNRNIVAKNTMLSFEYVDF